jgi:hypothetical protein
MKRAAWLQDRRMQKFLDVLSRREKGTLSMLEAGELLGMSERQFRRYRDRYEREGLEGLVDRRLGKPSPKRVPSEAALLMKELYEGPYQGWNVKHFHEHLVRDHGFRWGYTWVKTQLQTAGLVTRAARRGAHRRKRECKPLEGMILHQDGSRAGWLFGQAPLDLIVTMDDATSTIYSAFLVEEEGTASTFRACLEVFAEHGLPSSLYTDRGSHYFYTPKAGGKVAKEVPPQVGRALKHLGIEHIPAYSPEARVRSERMFGTLQDRLQKELALAGISEIEAANRFIKENYLLRHNARRRLGGDGLRHGRSGAPRRDLVHRGGAGRRSRQHRHVRQPPSATAPKARRTLITSRRRSKFATIQTARSPCSTGPDASQATRTREHRSGSARLIRA